MSIKSSFLFFLVVFSNSCGQAQEQNRLLDCEWCGTAEAPKDISWTADITPKAEHGEPMVLTGTVYEHDTDTPAAGVIIYFYHTNDEGVYAKRGDETGNGKRHGYLRGWVKTNKDGKYNIKTIRPKPYPSRSEPAHVHMTIYDGKNQEYWIPSTLFTGDPLITKKESKESEELAFPSIIELKKNNDGVWVGKRDVRLK